MSRVHRYAGESCDRALRGDKLAWAGVALAACGVAVGLAARDAVTVCVFASVACLLGSYALCRPTLARIHRERDWVRVDETALEYRRWPFAPERVPLADIVEVEVGPATWRHQMDLGRRLRIEHRSGAVDLGADADLEDWSGLLAALVEACELVQAETRPDGTVRYTRTTGATPTQR